MWCLLAPLGSLAASVATACACSACTCVTRQALTHSARLAYSFLFLLSMLLAWGLRDFAKPILSKIPWIVDSFTSLDIPPDAWFGAQAVYRVSMGNFLMFGSLALVMGGVRTRGDARDRRFHHGPVWIKLCLWLACNVAPFLLPNSAVVGYSWLARVASPFFLLLQMVILVDATHAWNDSWVEAGDEDERWLYGLLAATLGCYVGVAAIIALAHHWFLPSGVPGGCGTNAAVVWVALALVVCVSAASLHPRVASGSLFPASAVSLYVAYLSYSALLSEPRDEECNLLGKRLSAASGTGLAAGMAVTLLSVVWSAFRAGSNSKTFDWDGARDSFDRLSEGPDAAAVPLVDAASIDALEAPATQAAARGARVDAAGPSRAHADDDVPVAYSYAQFYAVFALASAYVSMLMTGWGSGITQRDVIDVGWTSVAVKVATACVAALLYIWTLVAPALFPDRVFE